MTPTKIKICSFLTTFAPRCPGSVPLGAHFLFYFIFLFACYSIFYKAFQIVINLSHELKKRQFFLPAYDKEIYMGEPILGIASFLRKGLRKMAYSPSDGRNGSGWWLG